MDIHDDDGNTLATVIRFQDISSGKNFITDNQSEFQLASFGLDENTVIERHYHPEQNRNILKTTEVLIVLDGELTIEIYDNDLNFVDQVLLKRKILLPLLMVVTDTCNKDTNLSKLNRVLIKKILIKRFLN